MNNKTSLEIVPVEVIDADDTAFRSLPSADIGPRLGAWYWVKQGPDHDDKPQPDWLGCAMKVGSNFVEVRSPECERGGSTYQRVHFDDFLETLRPEPRAAEVIRERIGHWQGETRRLMGNIERVTRELGMTPQDRLGGPAAQGAQAGGALMVLSSQADPKAYSTALAIAKDTTLPALFKELKEAHGEMASWMKAPIMETLAQMTDQRSIVADIDDRIFSVSLYAGLTEETVQVAQGAPAALTERLHVMQRMAFMDEECLANYKTGGMDIQGLGAFDAWLAEPENRDRILPFPRALIAMRVRRGVKDRDWEGSIGKLRVNLELAKADQLTFLYIRNGDQLWRLSTDIDFGELIFPDASVFDPNEPKMAQLFGGRVEGFVSRHWWEQERDRQIEATRKNREWAEAHKHEPHSWMRNPHRDYFTRPYSKYEPVDPSSVYYDDAMAKLGQEVKLYNRVALIIQGLFDRSMVLHPHLPARTWSAEGFDAAVKLVYDGTGVLHHGEAPDFEVYRARCNATLGTGSMVIGQDDFWQRVEGERESARRDRDWRDKSEYRPERFRPYGNPGPGYLAPVGKWSKTRGATFNWLRQRQRDSWRNEAGTVGCTVTVPADQLFNVDAYRPGDFRQFFADPRTRAQYLQWAPMLIAAEDYHADLAAAASKKAQE